MDAREHDLGQALEHCFEGEPQGPPVALYAARGRRHVQRRRVGAAVVAAGLVAAVGTGLSAVASGPAPSGGVPAASSGPTPPSPSPTVQTRYDFPEDEQDLARIQGYAIDGNGDLVLGEGVEVIERVDLPAGAGHADRSYGLNLVVAGEERWVYAPWNAPVDGVSRSAGAQVVPPVEGTTFGAWLTGVVDGQQPPEVDPAVELRAAQQAEAFAALDVDSRGRVSLNPGAEVVQRLDNPLGLAAPYQSAALRVTFRDVESWWLTTPHVAAPYIPLDGETFEEWVQARKAQGVTFSVSGPMPPLAKIVDGMPQLLPDVTVLRRVDNPLHSVSPARSVAYSARLGDGSEWWYLWELGPSGYFGAQVNRAVDDGYPSFEAWLAAQRSRVAW